MNKYLLRLIQEEFDNLILQQKGEDTTESLFSSLEELESTYINVNEKNLSQLKNKEEKAKEEEDFEEFKNIKNEQKKIIDRLIQAYEKKLELLNDISSKLNEEIQKTTHEGVGVFSNKEISEFNNEKIQIGDILNITSNKTSTDLRKIDEKGIYEVIKTSIPNIKSGDSFLLADPFKRGERVKITVVRNGKILQKPFYIKNITGITKNPKS